MVYRSKDGLSRDAMFPVIRDRHNNLWAASDVGVLQRFRGEPKGRAQREWKFQPPVRLLFEQRDGTVWAGSGDSLIRFQGDSMAVFGMAQGLAAVPLMAMAEGADRTIWMGTARGVQRFDDGHFGPVLARPGPRQTVLSMHADAAGRLWAQTYSGLNRIDGTHLTAFTPAQGMPELDMAWIFEDDKGYFWIVGRDGILRVSRADLDAVAEGRKRSVETQRFGVADGMRWQRRVSVRGVAGGLARPGRQAVLCHLRRPAGDRPGAVDDHSARPAGADRTRNRRRAEAGCRRRVGPRRQQSRIPLHRPHLSLPRVHAIPLPAGRLRCRLGGSRQPARRLLHQHSTRHLPVPGGGAQHGQRLERERRLVFPGGPAALLPDVLVRRAVSGGGVDGGGRILPNPGARSCAGASADWRSVSRNARSNCAGKSRFGSAPKRRHRQPTAPKASFSPT